MQKKYDKFYADWRDEHGRRHRKAFPTKARALKHQRSMQHQTTAKKARA